jgi:hypothetical protein
LVERTPAQAAARKKVLRIILIESIGLVLIGTGVGLAVGLSTGSAGWAFAALFILCGVFMMGSLVVIAVLGGRTGLRQTGKLYQRAAANALSLKKPGGAPI